MTPNQHFIAKADLSISNITNDGGLLVPEQAKQFIELMIQKSKLMSLVTTRTMSGPTFEIPKIGFTGEVLRPASEATALSEDDRVKPELGKVTLTSQEFIAEAKIPYGVVEDNVAQDTFLPFVTELLAKAVARDLEKLIIRGDTASGSTSLLRSLNGVLKQATSYVYNAGGVRMSKSVLEAMCRTMPSEFFDEFDSMAIITSKNAAIDYMSQVADRQTDLGDNVLMKKAAAGFGGIAVIPVPLMPENLGSGNKTNALLLDPKNINVGVQREIRIETQKDISARVYKIVATLRCDVKFAHEPACVKATEILASA